LTIVVIGNPFGGGYSSGDFVEYEPAKIVEPISQAAVYDYVKEINHGLPADKAGLPALSYYVGESGIGSSAAQVSHHAHEIGHYFGVVHTFGPDECADTPDDISKGEVFFRLGTITCGNPRTVTAEGKTVTPDRLNNEGYWGCMLGRGHNSFSPMQLAKAAWVLNNQLNRYPLVACQPYQLYNANQVECENSESLEL